MGYPVPVHVRVPRYHGQPLHPWVPRWPPLASLHTMLYLLVRPCSLSWPWGSVLGAHLSDGLAEASAYPGYRLWPGRWLTPDIVCPQIRVLDFVRPQLVPGVQHVWGWGHSVEYILYFSVARKPIPVIFGPFLKAIIDCNFV